MEKGTNKKINFISSLAVSTLGEKSIQNEDKESIDSNELEKTDNRINIAVPREIPQKNKSALFIQELMNSHYESHNKIKERTLTHIDKSTHFKIKLISTVTNVNMMELTNAIISKYLDEHKGEIDNLLKKANF